MLTLPLMCCCWDSVSLMEVAMGQGQSLRQQKVEVRQEADHVSLNVARALTAPVVKPYRINVKSSAPAPRLAQSDSGTHIGLWKLP